MSKFCLTLFALAMSIAQAQMQYFPKSSVDSRGNESKSAWYSFQLSALQEPSLLALTKTPFSQVYRFLWLTSFHHPVAIRLEVKPDGTSVLTTKVASGEAGFKPGVLTENTSKTLSEVQTRSFLSLVNNLNFWSAPNPVDDQKGTDGSQWIIEGVKDGQYHVVDRWSPSSGIARELGMMLAFDLAGLDIPKNEIY
jgi:hypothetical protein